YHMVESLKEILNKYNEEELPAYEALEKIYMKSVDYSNMVALPNGIIPNIGDSKDMEIDLERYYSSEIIEQSQSSGRATFYESGYDILKEEDTYLLFRAGYLQDYHHHNDDSLVSNLRSEEHTSELQSRFDLVCRLLLEKKKEEKHKHRQHRVRCEHKY